MNEIERLTAIYHETQEGSLCAQHALNNLLQREIFSAISLADIARQLDDEETSVLAHRHHESQNMDDTGFFSIQVLQRALKVFDVELVPYASQHPLAQQARANPQSIPAYICNLREHWLTIRQFGTQYFDLNSVSIAPKLISDTYLSLYLAQLQQSGYSIFIVNGILPPCQADERLANKPVDPTYFRALTERVNAKNVDPISKPKTSFEDKELQRAIKASVEHDNAEDRALQQVLAQSLREAQGMNPGCVDHYENDTEKLNQKLLDQAIAASLTNSTVATSNKTEDIPKTPEATSSDPQSSSTEPSLEELRQRRLQFFTNKEKPTTEEVPPSPKSDK